MLVRVYQKLRKDHPEASLIVSGTGKLENFLREQGVEVRIFEKETTFVDILSGKYGHVLGMYCSSIDAFGMASLEAQIAGMSTLILDRGGAGETIVSEDDDKFVGHLVDSEEDLFAQAQYYLIHKTFQKHLSIVNFSHHRDYFKPERLSHDLLILMSKTQVS